MGPEAKIEAYLKKRVLADGGRIRKMTWPGRRGAPDRMVWWPGPDLFLVELKAPGKKPTKQQEREHALLRADGFSVAVIDSKEAVDAFIKGGVAY
jgi:hypothetical protein